MNKQTLLALLILGNIATAQTTNEELEKILYENFEKTQLEIDFYEQKELKVKSNHSNNTSIPRIIRLKNKKDRIAFFHNRRPYFFKQMDTHQISNANADYIQNGNIDGLSGNFNGEGIKVAVFDGGRAYEKHDDFGGANSTRINNKEASSVLYNAHATAVTGMLGGQGYNYLGGNTKGILPLATFDNYSFSTTTLFNETQKKDVYIKISSAQPYLSNHSYGTNFGWVYDDDDPDHKGWYWEGEYDSTTQKYSSLEGNYQNEDRKYDAMVSINPSMIIVKSAGNEFGGGPGAYGEKNYYYSPKNTDYYVPFSSNDILPPRNCSQGYDCISAGSLAKNIIVVGATEKILSNNNRYTNANDVVKASYSSAGPRDDGGIKPDIAGVGNDILSASSDIYGSNDWDMGNGTSYSTPQITGIIGLWTEINRTLFNQDFNAASAKTLLIHSAQEAGEYPGPDVHFGWGFADAKAGAELLVKKANNEIIFEDKSLKNKTTNEILVESDGTQPIKVSISWIDPAVPENKISTQYNDRTSRLINDLDLRITNTITGEIFYPWKLDANNPMAPAHKGDNMVDNVEQVIIDTPTAGTYKIEVSHKGTLVDNDGRATGSQNYSILATGYTQIASDNSGNEGIFIDESKIISPTLITRDSNKLITIYHPYKQIENVSVYDSIGRLVFSDNINAEISQVDFSKFDEGVYIINAKFNDGFIKKSKILKR